MEKVEGEHSRHRKQHSWVGGCLEPMETEGSSEGLEGSGGPKVTI